LSGRPSGATAPFGHGRGARVHAIELLLDVADVGQIFVENPAVCGAELLAHPRRFLDHGIEQALLAPHVGCTPRGGTALAEDPLERHSRVDGHGQRTDVVAPRDGVEEHARIAVARAGGRAHVLGADLQRAQRRVLGHRVGDVLVDALARLDDGVRGLAAVGSVAVEPRGAGAHVHAAHLGVAVRRLHSADRHQVAAERLRAAASPA
jgi:hypothetical protein